MTKFDYTFMKGMLFLDRETDTYYRNEPDVVLEEGTYELERETPAGMDLFITNLAREHEFGSSIFDWTFNPETGRYRYHFTMDYGLTVEAYYIYIYFHKSRERITYSKAGRDRDTDG